MMPLIGSILPGQLPVLLTRATIRVLLLVVVGIVVKTSDSRVRGLFSRQLLPDHEQSYKSGKIIAKEKFVQKSASLIRKGLLVLNVSP